MDGRRQRRHHLRLRRRDLHQHDQRRRDVPDAEAVRGARARRAGRATAILGDVLKATAPIQEARIIAIPPPPVRGLGNGGGFKMQVQSRQSSDIGALLEAADDLIGPGQPEPGR